MDIATMQEIRRQAEGEILEALIKFTQRTGIYPSRVTVEPLDISTVSETRKTYTVEVKVEL